MRLDNVAPRLAMDNRVDRGLTHAESRRERVLRFAFRPSASNFANDVGRELGAMLALPSNETLGVEAAPVAVAARQSFRTETTGIRVSSRSRFGVEPATVFISGGPSAAPLGVPVCGVVGKRPQKEMADFYARRVVAAMADAKPTGNVTVGKKPRYAMRSQCVASCPEIAIPEPATVCRPFKTSCLFVAFCFREESRGVFLCENRVSHGEPPSKVPAVRLGEALARLPGRFYSTPSVREVYTERCGPGSVCALTRPCLET